MFRKKTPFQRAHKRLRKRRFFDRRSLPERIVQAVVEASKTGR